MSWKELFIANYEGKTDEAKSLEPFLKNNYKGNAYIPWATMERLVYMQDENAVFENITNEFGGLVHTAQVVNYQKNIQKGEVVSETESTMFSHTVRVSLTFMGKTFVEDYPIQDTDYSAARVYNQNLVNKALQRAKAKVAARATGLGLKLYEGFDLQFDEENPVPVKEEKKVERPKKKVEEPKKEVKEEKVVIAKAEEVAPLVADNSEELIGKKVVITDVEVSDDVKALYELITTTDVDKITPVLQRLNIAIIKKYGFSLNTTDTIEKLNEKASQLTDVAKFTRSIENLLN